MRSIIAIMAMPYIAMAMKSPCVVPSGDFKRFRATIRLDVVVYEMWSKQLKVG